MANKESISYLNYLIRTYASLTKMMAATKNRLQSLPGDHPVKFDRILHGEEKEEGLETIKGRISRLIGKELPSWDIWIYWLKDVPGIGNVTAAEKLKTTVLRLRSLQGAKEATLPFIIPEKTQEKRIG